MTHHTAFHAFPARRVTRRGFTLAEMIIAVTMLGLFGASAVTFYMRSLRSISTTAGRNDAQQNASFALDFLDHDLRIAGTGLVTKQPLVVSASPLAVAVNGDLITHDTSASASGTYFDVSVADSTALAWSLGAAQNLQHSSAVAYPDQTYYQSPPVGAIPGVLSEAETVQFWLDPDTAAGSPKTRYQLWRQVNGNVKQLLAQDIYYNVNTSPAPFRYYQSNAANQLIEVTAQLPLFYQKGATTTDSLLGTIREVRVTLTGWFHDPRSGKDVYRTVNENIRMPNAYMPRINACNSPPGPVASLSAAPSTAGQDTVGLTWGPSADDQARKKTVRMYLVYRKRSADSVFVELNSVNPISPLPMSYTYNDKNQGLVKGTSYDYEVVARDCTPALSSPVATVNVTPN